MILTVDTRKVFTAHVLDCPHLNFAGHQEAFDLVCDAPTRQAARDALDESGHEDSDLAFAPCLRDIR